MTFQLVDENANPAAPTPPPGVEFLPMQDNPNQKIAVFDRVDVDGGDLTDARAGTEPQTGQWVVNFTFNAVGARRFADVTRANVGRRFAIVLDNKVISAPVIREPILGGRGQISGNFTAASASDLALLLRAGALPAPLTVVEQNSIGPELGADSIRAGAIALGVGFLLVVGFMGFFYGLLGWFANINGRPPLQALEHGFQRAYRTIFDSNATAFLAHVMLFIFGSGPVRGFAVTITVGIATSLFTAWSLTRLLVSRWYIATRPRLLPV
jgi:preprotein translocase subunit SecD